MMLPYQKMILLLTLVVVVYIYTAFMATDSVHMDSKVTNRVTTSLLIFVGVMLLLLLPGAIYGFVKVCKIIITYEIKTFKDSAASVDEKYIIIISPVTIYFSVVMR